MSLAVNSGSLWGSVCSDNFALPSCRFIRSLLGKDACCSCSEHNTQSSCPSVHSLFIFLVRFQVYTILLFCSIPQPEYNNWPFFSVRFLFPRRIWKGEDSSLSRSWFVTFFSFTSSPLLLKPRSVVSATCLPAAGPDPLHAAAGPVLAGAQLRAPQWDMAAALHRRERLAVRPPSPF